MAAVVGCIIGTRIGLSHVPASLKDTVEGKDDVVKIVDRLV